MIKILNTIVWSLLLAGMVVLVYHTEEGEAGYFKTYMRSLEIYLFGVSAFFVLKRILFNRSNSNGNTIRLIKKSDYQTQLIGHGLILGLIYLLIVFNDGLLYSFSTVLIGLILTYYLVQVTINSHPMIYLDDRSFVYEDYFVNAWPWQEVERIELDEDYLRLISRREENFELDFTLIDDDDYQHLTEEVERSILDGEFTKDRSSKSLIEIVRGYAENNGVSFQQVNRT